MVTDHSGQVRSKGNARRKGVKPIRVLHIINDLAIGGTEIMLFKLLSHTDRSRFEPTVITLNGANPLADQIRDLGIPVESLGAKSSTANPAALLRLGRATRRLSPQLIQGWMYHGNLAAQAAAMFARRPIKVVWNIRQSLSSLDDEKPATARAIRLGARLSKWPDLILNNSQKSVAQHRALGFPKQNTFVVPNGFDTDTFAPSEEARASVRAELGVPENTVLVGRIGRYHHTKDYPNFLGAAAAILRDYPDTQFLVAGKDVDWNNDTLRRDLQQFGLVERIHLLGERVDIPRLTAALDIAVSSSHAEGFPNVIGEAMACSVACVVTDVGDSGWLVRDTGRIVRPEDSEALAAGCLELIHAGSEERERLGTAARKRIIDHYSIVSVARLYESLYQHIIAEGTLNEFAEANLRDKLIAAEMPSNHEQVFTLRPGPPEMRVN
jgi:glycosyltransferase involved in cell wall biosynthesis